MNQKQKIESLKTQIKEWRDNRCDKELIDVLEQQLQKEIEA
jgi:frataxin-like iron-binding protein CyaY